MKLSNFLKRQLTDFVDSYKKYFWKTSGTALTYTVLCFISVGVLLKFSDFDQLNAKRQVSILSYFFSRFSIKDTYSLVDLSHTVFVFFVSLFSIGLTKLSGEENPRELSFGMFIKKITGRDISFLFGILLLSSAIDFGLFKLYTLFYDFTYHDLGKWLDSLIFFVRIYVPLLLFSVTLYKLNSAKPLKLNFKKILFLWISLWMFNEFAYEISLFVRAHIFGLIMLPFDISKNYVGESILGILLMAFYFVGYHSAMTTSLKQFDEQ